jgi:hypothetical protein
VETPENKMTLMTLELQIKRNPNGIPLWLVFAAQVQEQ